MSEKIIEQKKREVAHMGEMVQKAASVIMVDYKGLSVAQDTELRVEMRKNNVEYKVLKNKLMQKCLQNLNIDGLDSALEGPTAFAFSYGDPIIAAKIVADITKKYKKMHFKGAILDGKALNAEQTTKLASIPAKPVLVAQLLGLLTNPMRSLAVALDQVAQQKS